MIVMMLIYAKFHAHSCWDICMCSHLRYSDVFTTKFSLIISVSKVLTIPARLATKTMRLYNLFVMLYQGGYNTFYPLWSVCGSRGSHENATTVPSRQRQKFVLV